jgi:hypothetical protein
LVSVTAEGVPRLGVVNVGEVARTLLPVPVFVTDTTFLLPSSARAVDAVRADSVDAPPTVRLPVAPMPPVIVKPDACSSARCVPRMVTPHCPDAGR